MNKKLETLHKQLVTNQKKVNNSSKNERIRKLKKLKKNIFEFRDEIKPVSYTHLTLPTKA